MPRRSGTRYSEGTLRVSFTVSFPVTTIIFAIGTVVLLSAALGIWMSGRSGADSWIVPLSGGVLAGIAVFWVLPELAGRFGWAAGSAWLGGGCAMLWLVDRYLYPVCPTCSHTHEHEACGTPLHGFATPLIVAASLHSFFDGLVLAAAWQSVGGELGQAIFWGIALHKVPEGFALGAMLRASLRTGKRAFAGVAATQFPMLLGGGLIALMSPYLEARWLVGLLAVAGGSFLYLGAHAVHGEWKSTKAGSTLLLAGAGAVAAALLKQFLDGFTH